MTDIKNKERNRKYRQENLPKVRAMVAASARKMRKENPERAKERDKSGRVNKKQKEMNKVRWAVESGKIEKPKYCNCCGQEKELHGHHKDYEKPLDVIWLCPACHHFLHSYMSPYIEVLKRVDDVDTIRHALISRMDLFMKWGKRSYKNTNDLKHENTSDIIEELATAIVKMLKGEG